MAYRRQAKPSGGAFTAAREAARQRIEAAQTELTEARAALESAQQQAAALRRTQDEAVSLAEVERARALRMAIALADPATVPPRLRESLGREQRERALTRALEGRGNTRSEPPRPLDAAEAVAALTAARTERSRALAAQVALLSERQRAVKRAAEVLGEAEDDLRRLDA